MTGTRCIIVVLAIIGIGLQAELWLSEDGHRKTRQLADAVSEQRHQNEQLRARNAALEAEVLNLKRSLDAAEERARSDLGLIGEAETFYQVVPARADHGE